jgi:hypothetical protein
VAPSWSPTTPARSNSSDSGPARSAFLSPAAPSADDEFLREYLSEYPEAERPSVKLLATIHPSSKFRAKALFSDLAGRFPVIVFDRSQYIMISQYKSYIYAELLPSRIETSLGVAFTRTYQFFKDLGHQLQFQVLDNEYPESLVRSFKQQRVIVERVPPNQNCANKAERAIQTFRNHFLSILVGAHPNFPINQWQHLLPQAEANLNMMHAWPDNMAISAYHGIHRKPYDFQSVAPSWSPTTPAAPNGTTTGASAFTSAPPSPTIALTAASSSPTPTLRASATASCSIRHPSFSQVHPGLTNCFNSPNDWP